MWVLRVLKKIHGVYYTPIGYFGFRFSFIFNDNRHDVYVGMWERQKNKHGDGCRLSFCRCILTLWQNKHCKRTVLCLDVDNSENVVNSSLISSHPIIDLRYCFWRHCTTLFVYTTAEDNCLCFNIDACSKFRLNGY